MQGMNLTMMTMSRSLCACDTPYLQQQSAGGCRPRTGNLTACSQKGHGLRCKVSRLDIRRTKGHERILLDLVFGVARQVEPSAGQVCLAVGLLWRSDACERRKRAPMGPKTKQKTYSGSESIFEGKTGGIAHMQGDALVAEDRRQHEHILRLQRQ